MWFERKNRLNFKIKKIVVSLAKNDNRKMSKGLFFHKIGIADMERIHSAIIGWMISDECEAFNLQIRSKFLNELFREHSDREYVKIESRVEYKDIDIVFLTVDQQGNQDCWIIENKIKTSQHSNQLIKYENVAKKVYLDHTKHYAFLTLIGETALCYNENWKNATYKQLVNLLEKYLEVKLDNVDSIILQEYYLSIKQMSDIADEFMMNPQLFPRVFTDGCKSKEDKKLYTNDIEEFIGTNGLETIFQKMYFSNILKEVINKSPIQYYWFHIDESRGNADLVLHFENYLEPWIHGKEFHFDMAFQAGTFKFAISRYYDTDLSKENIALVNTWKSELEWLQKEEQYPEYTRFNKSKGRARISISYKIERNWYKMERKEFIQLLSDEFKKANKMRQLVISRHEDCHFGKK